MIECARCHNEIPDNERMAGARIEIPTASLANGYTPYDPLIGNISISNPVCKNCVASLKDWWFYGKGKP